MRGVGRRVLEAKRGGGGDCTQGADERVVIVDTVELEEEMVSLPVKRSPSEW